MGIQFEKIINIANPSGTKLIITQPQIVAPYWCQNAQLILVRTKARDEWVQCSVYAMVVLRYQAQKEFAVDPKMWALVPGSYLMNWVQVDIRRCR